MEIITKYLKRHIPITSVTKLFGIITIWDAVSRLLEKYKNEAELLKKYINS